MKTKFGLVVLSLFLVSGISFAREGESVFSWVPPDGHFLGITPGLDVEYRYTIGPNDLRVATLGLPGVASLIASAPSAYERFGGSSPGVALGWVVRPFDGQEDRVSRAVGFGLGAYVQTYRSWEEQSWLSAAEHQYRVLNVGIGPFMDISFVIDDAWRANVTIPLLLFYGLLYQVTYDVVERDENAPHGFRFDASIPGGISFGRSF